MTRAEELKRLADAAEKKTQEKLLKHYKKTLNDLKKETKKYVDEYETLTFSEQMEAKRIESIGNKIKDIVTEMGEKEETGIKTFLKDKTIDSYYGTMYDIEGKVKMAMDFQMLPERYIENLVNKKVAGKVFSKRLYQNRTQLAKTVTSELLNGAVTGKGYAVIAKNISEQTEANYKQSLRITRTEGGRVQTGATQKAYEEAENLGIKMQKRWVASLDDVTREEHADLDGQTVDIDEEFTVDGYSAIGPRMFGAPEMDINCRCTTITIINKIEPKLRKDNITKEMFEYKSYNEWKDKEIKYRN